MSKGPWKRRNVLLEGELRDPDDPEIDVTEEEANAMEAITPPVEPVGVSPAPATFSMTATDLQAMITAAVTAAAQGNAALADAVTQGIAQSREPIHENKIAPDISALNPLGERDAPRPGLKCAFFYGTQDGQTKVIHRSYPLLDADLSLAEQIALNTLQPVHAVVERMDGAKMKVSIVPDTDAVTDALTRLTIVIPGDIMAKGSHVKNMLPGVINLVKQITGHDYGSLTTDDLEYFRAAHRSGRYVAVREPVAA